MQTRKKSPVVPLLGAIVALQLMCFVWQWGGLSATPAMAQIPDAGDQRLQMIDQLKATNAKLDTLLDLLRHGQLQVKVVDGAARDGR